MWVVVSIIMLLLLLLLLLLLSLGLQSCADSLSDGEPVEFGLDDEQGSWATRSRAGDSVVSGSMWGGPERGALDGACDQFFSVTGMSVGWVVSRETHIIEMLGAHSRRGCFFPHLVV